MVRDSRLIALLKSRMWLAFIACGMFAGGCARPEGPKTLSISSASYAQAFDAAAEAARRNGLQPLLKDRRSGIIETDTRIAGSLLEPWRKDKASFDEDFANTVAMQRRRARFEFLPVGEQPPTVADSQSDFQGPDLLGQGEPLRDLTTFDGELTLRVSVYVERSQAPGLRRNTWSRSLMRSTKVVDPETQLVGPNTFWTPISRDELFEERLLAEVARNMNLGNSER